MLWLLMLTTVLAVVLFFAVTFPVFFALSMVLLSVVCLPNLAMCGCEFLENRIRPRNKSGDL